MELLEKAIFLWYDVPYPHQKYKLLPANSHTPYVKDTTARG